MLMQRHHLTEMLILRTYCCHEGLFLGTSAKCNAAHIAFRSLRHLAVTGHEQGFRHVLSTTASITESICLQWELRHAAQNRDVRVQMSQV